MLAPALAIVVIVALPRMARGELAYGVTSGGSLIGFDTAAPGNILSGVAITGLQQNEVLQGIDVRPATGELFALGSFSRLYKVDRATGVAVMVGTGAFSPALNGSSFGFDFNPTIDRIRVVSDANQNLVLNPISGGATVATSLFFASGDANQTADPNVLHSAYSNNFSGATTSQLYGIDTGLDILVTQANSVGTLGTVGPIGTDVTDVGGFDISGDTGAAFLAVKDAAAAKTMLWSINLASGAGSFIGEVGGGSTLTALTILPAAVAVPEPGSIAVVGLPALMLITRRRRAR
jgi:hypothetical protein